MRRPFLLQTWMVAAIAACGFSAPNGSAIAANFRAPPPQIDGAILPVNHRRYRSRDYYYPYYPYPAYAPYYLGPPPVAYPPPVVYYPGPRYYPGPAYYGPRLFIRRPYGAYYADW
jgi:hypothetical protein